MPLSHYSYFSTYSLVRDLESCVCMRKSRGPAIGVPYLEKMSREREERAKETDRLEWAPYSVDYGFYTPLMSGSIDGTDTRPHDRGVVRAMSVECIQTTPLHIMCY